MSTPAHGIQVVIAFERLSAEGKVDKEYIGTLDGGAATQTLYTEQFPITDSSGTTTDTETEVDVFTDDTTVGSWTEYADDGSDFTITGATGAVVIAAAENQAGNSGERIAISYYTTWQMGRGQSFDLEARRQLIEVHKMGDPDPQDIVAGVRRAITITAVDLYLDRRMIGPILSAKDFYETMTSVTVKVYPTGTGSGERYFDVAEVSWESVQIRGSTETLIEVTATLKGTVMTSTTVP